MEASPQPQRRGLAAVSEEPQTSIYETELDDPELAQALADRQAAKAELADARKNFNDVDEVVKQKVSGLDLGNGTPVRCGNFLITESTVPARSVSFETEETTRISIKPLES